MGAPKILDKIRKLLAKADGALTQAEAEAFAAKAQELLVKHKLGMSDVERASEEAEDPIGHTLFDPDNYPGLRWKSRRVLWEERLAGVVAECHFCLLNVLPGSNLLTFIGRESDRKIAAYLYAMLARTAQQLAEKEYRIYARLHNERGWRVPPGFKASFYTGFTHAIAQRLQAARKAASAGTSIVLVMDPRVREYQEQRSGGEAKSLQDGAQNRAGIASGYEAGKSASLVANAMEGGPAGPRLLQAGRPL